MITLTFWGEFKITAKIKPPRAIISLTMIYIVARYKPFFSTSHQEKLSEGWKSIKCPFNVHLHNKLITGLRLRVKHINVVTVWRFMFKIGTQSTLSSIFERANGIRRYLRTGESKTRFVINVKILTKWQAHWWLDVSFRKGSSTRVLKNENIFRH